MTTRMHQLFRRSVTTGKCEDCGLIENHSNSCIDAAPIRQIEALYDKLEATELQNRDLQEQLDKLGAAHDDEIRAQKVILIQRDEAESKLRESNRLINEYRKTLAGWLCDCRAEGTEVLSTHKADCNYVRVEKKLSGKREESKFDFCRHAFNIGMNCIREKGHGGPCR